MLAEAQQLMEDTVVRVAMVYLIEFQQYHLSLCFK